MINADKQKHVQNISIEFDATIIQALKQMDLQQVKLLVVTKGGKFYGLLSIGDIQRAIIKNTPFSVNIKDILRSNIVVCRDTDDMVVVREKMISFRSESMPIVRADGQLADVIFWNEVFNEEERIQRDLLSDIPAVIMAGGMGVRLKPITNVIPKPLIPVGDKTIMENIINRLNSVGITRIYTTVNYKHEMIDFYFKSIPDKKYDISFHLEDKPLGTAGSLQLLKDEIKTTFFISNCDIIIDQDYRDIYEYHTRNKNDITIVAALKNYSIPYGIVETRENGILTDIKEKPEYTFMINSGMYILEPAMIDQIPEDTFYNITDLIEKVKNNGGRVGVFPVSEKSWFDIGEWDEYRKTLAEFENRWGGAKS